MKSYLSSVNAYKYNPSEVSSCPNILLFYLSVKFMYTFTEDVANACILLFNKYLALIYGREVGSSRYLVCELLVGGGRRRLNDFLKFVFLG